MCIHVSVTFNNLKLEIFKLNLNKFKTKEAKEIGTKSITWILER